MTHNENTAREASRETAGRRSGPRAVFQIGGPSVDAIPSSKPPALLAFRSIGAFSVASRRGPRALLTLLALGAAALLLALAAPSPALAFRGHVFSHTFGSAGSGNGQLSEPSAVAVNDATGRIYVLDQGNSRIEYFSSAGVYEGQFDGTETPAGAFAFGTEPLASGIAVDNSCYLQKLSGLACSSADPSDGALYVTDLGHNVVDKFGPEGAYRGQLEQESGGGVFEFRGIGGENSLDGIAVDRQGTVSVYNPQQHVSGDVAEFSDAEPSTLISTRELEQTALSGGFVQPGFAVDSAGDIYARYLYFNAASEDEHFVSKFDSSGQIIANVFREEETSGLALDPSNDEVFLGNLDSIGAFGPDGSIQQRFGAGHLSAGAGLAVGPAANPSYSTVYVADAGADDVAAFSPEPPKAPTVEPESESVADVTSSSATLAGELNPRSEPGEAPTAYRFEYGPCASLSACPSSPYELSSPLPPGQLPPEFEAQSVGVHLQGLQPHTAYHFRLSAENSHSLLPAFGEELTFTTQALAPASLPDHRAWELVSPPEKHGALIFPINPSALVQAAADGDAISYGATAPTEADPQGYTNNAQILSARSASGWSSRDIDVPQGQATGANVSSYQQYTFFSADLSQALLQPFGAFDPALSAEASEQTPYLRSNFPAGDAAALCAQACFRPLVTTAEGFANVPPGTVFGEEGSCPPRLICGPQFLGATEDLGHVVFESNAGLTAAPGNKGGLYEWSAGRAAAEALQFVSVLPGGKAASGPKFGTVTILGSKRNAISADGSRVIFSDEPVSNEVHLYLRDLARGETVELDAVQGGPGAAQAPSPQLQTASSDASKVFFTDRQQLLPDSAASGEDLYECQIVELEGKLHCRLTDLTPPHEGEAASSRGVVAAGADGSSVYYVADSVLTTAPNPRGEVARPGNCSKSGGTTCNLYLDQDGTTRFIAALSSADVGDFATGSLQGLTARLSPDGRWLAFMSQRPLTGYDNRDAVSGRPDQEVFLYDSRRERLLCASCNPTGARPHGVAYRNRGLAFGFQVWNPDTWLAANIPGWSPANSLAPHQSRYLSDSGRLFFNSSDALVPSDSNGNEDVYQYEPPAEAEGSPAGDTCTEASPTYSPASEGCVDLISSGTSPEESAFLDASESGDDVFFITAAKLAAKDHDTSLDVYDARVEGGEAQEVKPVECAGDACQQPASTPDDATPGSLTFDGAGDVKECPKGKTLKKGKCVKQKAKGKHHKKKHHGKSRKRTANRNAGGSK